MNVIPKSSLSPDRSGLLELMQRINFGRLEGLVVRGGEPLLDPPPKVVREIKFGGENDPRTERALGDFALKTQVVELFEHFDRLQNAEIEVLSIKHGLPFGMHVEAKA